MFLFFKSMFLFIRDTGLMMQEEIKNTQRLESKISLLLFNLLNCFYSFKESRAGSVHCYSYNHSSVLCGQFCLLLSSSIQ